MGAPNEDDEAVDAGAAYVFQRDNGGNDNWGEVRKLTASNAKAGHRFGTGVAVSGDTAVVGACCEGAGGNNRGTAYVFRRDEGGAGNWGEVKKLTASDAEDFDSFGISVAASSDIIVVGAYEATGDFNTGAAYMFQRDEGGAGNWGEVKKLTASDAARHDFFGVSVSVSGDTVMVGASRCCRNDNPTGIEGAAYVFLRDAGGKDNWGEVTKLTASDAESGDFFGDSVAVSGDTALIGGLGEDDGGSFAGAAYVFQRDDGGVNNWGEVKKLTASDAEAFSYFGTSVAVSADTALVGALQEAARGNDAGAVYVFQRDDGGIANWGEVTKLTASDAQTNDLFSAGVAVSGDTAVVGADFEDGGATDGGAVYVFERSAGSPIPTAKTTDTPQPASTDTPVPTSKPDPTATPEVSTGDANCDGTVNVVDAALTLQLSAGLIASLPCAESADVNADGIISPVDAALILQFAAGLLSSLPP